MTTNAETTPFDNTGPETGGGPDPMEFVVTPFRLGEMYVNTVVNIADMLENKQHALADQTRNAPDQILAPLPTFDPEDVLAFIAGAASQVDQVLDHLAHINAHKAQPASQPPGPHDTSLEDELQALTLRIDQATEHFPHPEIRDDGYRKLGVCDFNPHHPPNPTRQRTHALPSLRQRTTQDRHRHQQRQHARPQPLHLRPTSRTHLQHTPHPLTHHNPKSPGRNPRPGLSTSPARTESPEKHVREQSYSKSGCCAVHTGQATRTGFRC